MKEEYFAPDMKIFIYLPAEPIAGDEQVEESEHDNGYVDWFADEDASRRGTKE